MGSTVYLNEVTGEILLQHPLDRYRELMGFSSQHANEISKSCQEGIDNEVADPNTGEVLQQTEIDTIRQPESAPTLNFEGEEIFTVPAADFSGQASPNGDDMTPATQLPPSQPSAQELLEYHCQWKERSLFGLVSVYGLTLRYNLADGTTSVRFDGVVDSEWTFTALKGSHGAIEPHDLTIGAKVEVFGRHLSISSANSAAVRWIEREAKRLTKLQAKFRRKIVSVGQKPIIREPEQEVIRHVGRDEKKAGGVNLRKMLAETAKLGEQLAQLGLADLIAS